MLFKKCSRCKKEKNISEFWKRGGNRQKEWHNWCKDCTREARFNQRRTTKEKVIKLLGGKCALCGHKTDTGVSLSVDHRNPQNKGKSAGNLYQWKWSRVLEELKLGNCWLLCLNCHAELEFRRGREGTV